ncbi:MAG: hypothetical protein JO060_08750 [Candidatus Eremiobacteraeota bacterium]|nr:hypothetical protein [Candidatus Eremiobacteraeota bacterium]
MHVGEALIAHARAAAKRSIVVVGTAKNVGKTVTVTAMAEALERRAEAFGLCSIGHDGESLDVLEGTAKPRVFLRAGAFFVTARALLPAHPATEILEMPGEDSALGPIVVARVRTAGFFEIAGPPSAAALRRMIQRLFAHGAVTVLVDGAIDRIAAVRSEDAIVIATGPQVARHRRAPRVKPKRSPSVCVYRSSMKAARRWNSTAR